MDFKVVFKDPFLGDLERAVRLIAAQNPAAARHFGELALEMCQNLSFFPERHPNVRQRPGIRRFVLKKRFKIFYRVQHDLGTVEILRLWDGFQENDPRF